MEMNIKNFWQAIVDQNAEEIRDFFKETAMIRWHNTNEEFTLEEFIRANCEYPGKWDGEVERIEEMGNLIITVTRVFSKESDLSVHVTSFISMKDGKIMSMDEYWGDDGETPKWRAEMKIGKKIR
ncbi:nuclear transport factor 2 family protein [Clostridiales bacterium COT073_COT-073]|nr:nuclear transport factor 2 family protein [Clostridiales bacterium COT073_COT-073]